MDQSYESWGLRQIVENSVGAFSYRQPMETTYHEGQVLVAFDETSCAETDAEMKAIRSFALSFRTLPPAREKLTPADAENRAVLNNAAA